MHPGWNAVIGQSRVVEAVRRALDRGRVAHAYLFHGPDGSGKRAAALALAAALQCERGGSEACGECGACGRSAKLIHPDVQILLPQPSDVKADEMRERIDRLAANPYATVDFVRRSSLEDTSASSNRQVQYSVARVHDDLHRVMSFKPVEGRYKVAVVTDVDLMRREAANAFLKLLEEPTPRTVFILTTSRVDRLLPTILSRCQRVRFDRLADEEIAQALTERAELAAGLAEAVARMADGSYARAVELAESQELLAVRQEVVDFLRSAYQAWSHADRCSAVVEQLGRQGRERLKFFLTLTMAWLRDLLLLRTMGDDAALVNVDQREALARFSDNLPHARVENMVDLVEQAIELIERNVQARLALTVLAQRLAETMRGDDVRELVQGLTETAP